MFKPYTGKHPYSVSLGVLVGNRKDLTGLSQKKYRDLRNKIRAEYVPIEYSKKTIGDRVWQIRLQQDCAEAIKFEVKNSDCNTKLGGFEANFSDKDEANKFCDLYTKRLKELQEDNPFFKLIHVSIGKHAGSIAV